MARKKPRKTGTKAKPRKAAGGRKVGTRKSGTRRPVTKGRGARKRR